MIRIPIQPVHLESVRKLILEYERLKGESENRGGEEQCDEAP